MYEGSITIRLEAGSGALAVLSGPTTIALGLLGEIEYPAVTRHIRPGDTLFLYTDGVTEAINDEREFFSVGRLHATVSGAHAEPVDSVTRRVVEEVRSFAAERDQSDDISVLALRWLAPMPAAANRRAPANTVDVVASVA